MKKKTKEKLVVESNAFGKLRMSIRHALADAVGIKSNPGWSDEDVLNGIEQWKNITIGHKTRIESLEKLLGKAMHDLVMQSIASQGKTNV